eukprot:TRINITY_DN5216_c0_g1_i1.p1 TRINITY_DN5216_c0_g1~~TRINITY_DN5216_c0_g1_i1.p1  ORF type:complete len:441 (+),score=111.26 TRINITY_DN5216_c0_g1_i1:96-1325(+)
MSSNRPSRTAKSLAKYNISDISNGNEWNIIPFGYDKNDNNTCTKKKKRKKKTVKENGNDDEENGRGRKKKITPKRKLPGDFLEEDLICSKPSKKKRKKKRYSDVDEDEDYILDDDDDDDEDFYIPHEKKISNKRRRTHNKDSDDSKDIKPERYRSLKKNKYKFTPKTHMENSVCSCIYIPEFSACDYNCMNRLVCIECDPKFCPCGKYCKNQRFQKNQYKDVEVFRTEKKGWGLRAEEDIKENEFIIEYIGEVIDKVECIDRIEKRQSTNFYIISLDNNYMIDATYFGSKARFTNHSCSPNCRTQKWFVRGLMCVGLFALKDIKKGEELTFDYQFIRMGSKKQPCYCGSSNCRKFLGAKPLKPKKSIKKRTKTNKKQKTKKKKNKKKNLMKVIILTKILFFLNLIIKIS